MAHVQPAPSNHMVGVNQFCTVGPRRLVPAQRRLSLDRGHSRFAETRQSVITGEVARALRQSAARVSDGETGPAVKKISHLACYFEEVDPRACNVWIARDRFT